MSDSVVPAELLYAESHEWIRKEGDVVAIGITDHAQHELGDIVFVELPEVGQKVEPGKGFAVIEAVKTVADVYSPAAGEVVEVNEELGSNAGAINANAYQSWIAKIRLSEELPSSLLSAEGYKALL